MYGVLEIGSVLNSTSTTVTVEFSVVVLSSRGSLLDFLALTQLLVLKSYSNGPSSDGSSSCVKSITSS